MNTAFQRSTNTTNRADSGGVLTAGLLLGIGLGGFADGIVLHQLLQWHNMLSSKVLPIDVVSIKYNMVWDGIFHAFTWLVTLAGVALLWRATRQGEVAYPPHSLAASGMMGWGLFNLVEGLIDHQLLGLHHVHPGANQLAWDLGFLASGAALLGVGYIMMRGRNAPSHLDVAAQNSYLKPS